MNNSVIFLSNIMEKIYMRKQEDSRKRMKIEELERNEKPWQEGGRLYIDKSSIGRDH